MEVMPRRASWLGGGGLDRTEGVARTDVDGTAVDRTAVDRTNAVARTDVDRTDVDGTAVDSAGCCHSFGRASSVSSKRQPCLHLSRWLLIHMNCLGSLSSPHRGHKYNRQSSLKLYIVPHLINFLEALVRFLTVELLSKG